MKTYCVIYIEGCCKGESYLGEIINGRFKITNDILNMALFGGRLCNGYINNDEFARSRALLTFLTQEIFSIHRFPGYDEFYRFRYDYHMRESFNQLKNDNLREARSELESLYKHTQNYLKYNFGNKPFLRLKRSLNYEEQKQVTNQLLDNYEEVKFESNIILSFSDENWLGSYNSKVLLTMDVPFNKILIHYDSIEFPNGTTGDEKENEVWVMNDDPYGRIIQHNHNFKSKGLSRENKEFPFNFPPITEDYWSYDYAFQKHNKIWDDSWVRFIIELRRKMKKI